MTEEDWQKCPSFLRNGNLVADLCERTEIGVDREIQIYIRAAYYLLNSIAGRTSLEIREFTLPAPGPF